MLTPKQEVFVQNIIKGKSQADAYRAAYNCKRMTDKTIHEAASRLMADSKIATRVNELRKQIDNSTIMSAQERLQWLTDLIANSEENTNDRLKAIDIMNRMQGEYITQVKADVSIDKLEDLI
jgi:phage terminase small subunit